MQLITFSVSFSCHDVDSCDGKVRHSSERTKSADMGCRFACMSLFYTEHCPTEIMCVFEAAGKCKPLNPDGCIFFSIVTLVAELGGVLKPAVRTGRKMTRRYRKLQYSGCLYLKTKPNKQTKNQTKVLSNTHLQMY